MSESTAPTEPLQAEREAHRLLLSLVRRTREAQREYFRAKTNDRLKASKALEAQLDRAIEDLDAGRIADRHTEHGKAALTIARYTEKDDIQISLRRPRAVLEIHVPPAAFAAALTGTAGVPARWTRRPVTKP
jgi:hypothetical protein